MVCPNIGCRRSSQTGLILFLLWYGYYFSSSETQARKQDIYRPLNRRQILLGPMPQLSYSRRRLHSKKESYGGKTGKSTSKKHSHSAKSTSKKDSQSAKSKGSGKGGTKYSAKQDSRSGSRDPPSPKSSQETKKSAKSQQSHSRKSKAKSTSKSSKSSKSPESPKSPKSTNGSHSTSTSKGSGSGPPQTPNHAPTQPSKSSKSKSSASAESPSTESTTSNSATSPQTGSTGNSVSDDASLPETSASTGSRPSHENIFEVPAPRPKPSSSSLDHASSPSFSPDEGSPSSPSPPKRPVNSGPQPSSPSNPSPVNSSPTGGSGSGSNPSPKQPSPSSQTGGSGSGSNPTPKQPSPSLPTGGSASNPSPSSDSSPSSPAGSSPTDRPGVAETAAPSAIVTSTSAQPTVSAMPSIVPSASPMPTSSMAPSVVPSVSPIPTISSSPASENEPGRAPSSETCGLDEGGTFGSFDGDEVEVPYFYQVETLPNVGSTEATEFLHIIETAVSNTLLPTLFPDQCSVISKRTPCRKLSVTGVSSYPLDAILTGVACEGTRLVSGSNCFVVDGGTIIYLREGTNLTETIATARSTIREKMKSGAFDNVTESVVRVTFRNETDIQSATGSAGEGQGPESDDSETNLSWLWAVIGTSGVLVLSYLVLRATRRYAHERQESASAAYESIGNDHEQPCNESPTASEIFLETSTPEPQMTPAVSLVSARAEGMAVGESTSQSVTKIPEVTDKVTQDKPVGTEGVFV